MTRQNSFPIATKLIGLVLGMSGCLGWAAAAPVEGAVVPQELTVGIHNRPPWGYRDAAGEVHGYHVDLVRAAFSPLGVKKINFVVSEFGALIPGLNANRTDIIASGIAITPLRCKQVIFGDPDLSVGDGLLVKKGNPLNLHSYADIARNPNVRLSAGRGTENAKNAIAAGIPESRLLQLQDTPSLLAALAAGRADAGSLSAPSAIEALKDKNIKDLERAEPFTGLIKPDGKAAMMYTAIAFRPRDSALRDLYNQQLAKLKADGTVKKIMATYGFTAAEMAPDSKTDTICRGD